MCFHYYYYYLHKRSKMTSLCRERNIKDIKKMCSFSFKTHLPIITFHNQSGKKKITVIIILQESHFLITKNTTLLQTLIKKTYISSKLNYY